MKLRRRGFIATLAALVAGGKAVAASEPEPAPPEPTADDVRLSTPTGGDCAIRGGNGTGYAGAPVHVSGSVYLDPATDQLLYSDGGRWTPIVAGATKD
jgi:hypothetical protein